LKTQTKTILILVAAFVSIIMLFGGFVYFSVANYSHQEFYKLLEIRAFTAAKAELDKESDQQQIKDLRTEFFEKLPNEQDYVYEISPGNLFIAEAKLLNVPASFFLEIMREGKAEYNRNSMFYKGIEYKSHNKKYIVIASAKNHFLLHHSEYLFKTLSVSAIIAILFSLFIAVYFSKSFFKPLRIITDRVKQISSENLHLRLNIKDKTDELNELTSTFNDMLDRIETSFETQNNFISNASHELRTPLTAIIGEADVALSKIRTIDEYIETIKVILDEAEKLDKKTKALLFLAQTGFNGKIQRFDKVRIDQLLWDVKETIEKLDAKNKVHLDMSLLPENPMKLKVKGNEQLLHLALSNIISNACKYSDYKQVNVSLGASKTHVVVVIKDFGIGIPQNELRFIYDPFFRASNTKNYEGYGIGLPLTQNIIRMHQGEILVSSIEKSGTTVQIKIPIGNFEPIAKA
jgi:signal transduction histidine kinase